MNQASDMNKRLGGSSEQPSSSPTRALGRDCGSAGMARRTSAAPVNLCKPHGDPKEVR
jgi:hypothetical protein